jgi:hypothetical protein
MLEPADILKEHLRQNKFSRNNQVIKEESDCNDSELGITGFQVKCRNKRKAHLPLKPKA